MGGRGDVTKKSEPARRSQVRDARRARRARTPRRSADGFPRPRGRVFFFRQKTAYELGLGIPAEPLFRSSVPTTLPTAYDVYPLDGRHDGGYYTVKDCVTIDVLPRTPGNNVYVGFMVWSNFTATKCRGLVSLNQVIKEIICL